MNAAGNENILLGTADGAVTIFNNNIAMYNTSATENVFNEASNDIDFRIESNGDANCFVVDAGGDRVDIRTGGANLGGVFNVLGTAVISIDDNSDVLTLVSTDADATSGPVLRLYRNSASPADSDDIGAIRFDMRNDNSQDFTTFQMTGDCSDVSDGTEDAEVHFDIMTAGTLREYMRMASGSAPSVTFNEDSQDIDFRVESNGNANMLFVDGGNDRVHINGSTGTRELNVSGDNTRLLLYSTNNSTGAGQLQFGDENNEQVGRIMYEHNTNAMSFHTSNAEKMRITSDGKLSTGGETAPDIGDGGLTLDQNAVDTKILTFKSSDVAHNITNEAESDTYFAVTKGSATKGGIRMDALSEQGGEIMQFIALGNIDGGATDTATSTSGLGAMSFGVNLMSNNDGAANDSVADAGNLAVFRNFTATQFIIKGNGAIHSNAAAGTYDSYEDAQLVRAFDLTNKKGVIASQFDKYVSYNHEALADAELVGRDEDGTPNMMMNITGFIQLHNGAIWQQYEKTERLANAVYELAKATVGEKKANEILEQNKIKLLN